MKFRNYLRAIATCVLLISLALVGCSTVESVPQAAPPSPPLASAPEAIPASSHVPDLAGSHPFAYWGTPISVNVADPVTVLPKAYFTIGYSELRKDPLWVCYATGPATDLATHSRKAFVRDVDTVARVTTADYDRTGYSRGHMAPKFAIGSRYGKDGSDATFVMSNVCPQFQSHIDGQWGDLEVLIDGVTRGNGQYVKGWADVYERVWVAVGPIFDGGSSLLPCGVEVPGAFFCIVIDEEDGQPRALAFILEHKDERDPDLTKCLTTIREIQLRTGLDFESEMPDAEEELLETTRAKALWPIPANNRNVALSLKGDTKA